MFILIKANSHSINVVGYSNSEETILDELNSLLRKDSIYKPEVLKRKLDDPDDKRNSYIDSGFAMIETVGKNAYPHFTKYKCVEIPNTQMEDDSFYPLL